MDKLASISVFKKNTFGLCYLTLEELSNESRRPRLQIYYVFRILVFETPILLLK